MIAPSPCLSKTHTNANIPAQTYWLCTLIRPHAGICGNTIRKSESPTLKLQLQLLNWKYRDWGPDSWPVFNQIALGVEGILFLRQQKLFQHKATIVNLCRKWVPKVPMKAKILDIGTTLVPKKQEAQISNGIIHAARNAHQLQKFIFWSHSKIKFYIFAHQSWNDTLNDLLKLRWHLDLL